MLYKLLRFNMSLVPSLAFICFIHLAYDTVSSSGPYSHSPGGFKCIVLFNLVCPDFSLDMFCLLSGGFPCCFHFTHCLLYFIDMTYFVSFIPTFLQSSQDVALYYCFSESNLHKNSLACLAIESAVSLPSMTL